MRLPRFWKAKTLCQRSSDPTHALLDVAASIAATSLTASLPTEHPAMWRKPRKIGAAAFTRSVHHDRRMSAIGGRECCREWLTSGRKPAGRFMNLGGVDKFSRVGSFFVRPGGHQLRAGDNTRHI